MNGKPVGTRDLYSKYLSPKKPINIYSSNLIRLLKNLQEMIGNKTIQIGLHSKS